jgi:hypothetical protein
MNKPRNFEFRKIDQRLQSVVSMLLELKKITLRDQPVLISKDLIFDNDHKLPFFKILPNNNLKIRAPKKRN